MRATLRSRACRLPTAKPDLTLTREAPRRAALRRRGGTPPCSVCHGTRQARRRLSRWGTAADAKRANGETGGGQNETSVQSRTVRLLERAARRAGWRPSAPTSSRAPSARCWATPSCSPPTAIANYPFRLAGTRLCALFGRELKSESFLKLWERAGQTAMRELLAVVMEEKIGVVASVTGATADDSLLAGQPRNAAAAARPSNRAPRRG